MTTYCGDRVVFDADSHIMETPDWLSRHVEAKYQDQIQPFRTDSLGFLEETIRQIGPDGAHTPETAAELEGDVVGGPKGWSALGSSNPAERSRALDLMGVKAQLIFAGISVGQFLFHKNLDVVYAGARAHNRAMAEFCADDPRMHGVGIAPLHDPAEALVVAQEAIDLGCRAIWVRAQPDGGRSPGHNELDPFWRLLEATSTPFVLHVGAQAQQIRADYMNNGGPPVTDWMGTGEQVRAKDFTTYHHVAEAFLAVLVIDGVLGRFPGLRGATVELGSSWVPGWLDRLKYVVKGWGKSDPSLTAFDRSPYEQAIDQLRFVPLPFEDVGAIIKASTPEIYMFGTDYPHPEGSRDPLGRMLATMTDLDEDTHHRFLASNYAQLMQPSGS